MISEPAYFPFRNSGGTGYGDHRKSSPSVKHKSFAALAQYERLLVKQLAELLQIADGLDHLHLQLVQQ